MMAALSSLLLLLLLPLTRQVEVMEVAVAEVVSFCLLWLLLLLLLLLLLVVVVVVVLLLLLVVVVVDVGETLSSARPLFCEVVTAALVMVDVVAANIAAEVVMWWS